MFKYKDKIKWWLGTKTSTSPPRRPRWVVYSKSNVMTFGLAKYLYLFFFSVLVGLTLFISEASVPLYFAVCFCSVLFDPHVCSVGEIALHPPVVTFVYLLSSCLCSPPAPCLYYQFKTTSPKTPVRLYTESFVFLLIIFVEKHSKYSLLDIRKHKIRYTNWQELTLPMHPSIHRWWKKGLNPGQVTRSWLIQKWAERDALNANCCYLVWK